MKPDDVVTIYEDPLTEKKPEGQARLVKLMFPPNYNPDMELWEVQLLAEPKETYFRWVKKAAP